MVKLKADDYTIDLVLDKNGVYEILQDILRRQTIMFETNLLESADNVFNLEESVLISGYLLITIPTTR